MDVIIVQLIRQDPVSVLNTKILEANKGDDEIEAKVIQGEGTISATVYQLLRQ